MAGKLTVWTQDLNNWVLILVTDSCKFQVLFSMMSLCFFTYEVGMMKVDDSLKAAMCKALGQASNQSLLQWCCSSNGSLCCWTERHQRKEKTIEEAVTLLEVKDDVDDGDGEVAGLEAEL